MTDTTRQARLQQFVDWRRDHVRGDEKGEAQIFLDRLFQAFGHKGLLECGGSPEFRIRKGKEEGGGTAFADLVWKPHVLIEMKRRGEDLSRHYRQAFDYWTRLVPGRPRYVVLCNFDELWVYDFENQMDTPVDRVPLTDLPQRYGPLAFLFPTHEKPTFGNDQLEVTREAADALARCFNKLIARAVDRELAQRFILQMLVSLFAEDIGLLDRYFVAQLLDECHTPRDGYDRIGGLFEQMNNPHPATGGRYKGVRYFNGGIFRQPARIELEPDEINQLKAASKENWSRVRPEIFGTLFEHSLGKADRHAYGAHFTSAVDIMKIVKPTISEPWEALIESTVRLEELEKLHRRMLNYKVLDPACGSGNFLYIAYRELKRLEVQLVRRISERSRSAKHKHQLRFGAVNTRQFFGMDVNPFAVELAKVTMMIAHKLAIDELHIDEPALPLDNLDGNFTAVDALLAAPRKTDGEPDYTAAVRTPWPEADVIIGNPPFLGAKRLKPERGPDYVNAVRRLYPEVPGMADYCVYWFRRAHDHLPVMVGTDDTGHVSDIDPLRGRAGLVGTQNIRNNQSRVGGLDHIAASGIVVEAVDNQPWSGEANVHVSIANWVKPGTSMPGRRSGPAAEEKEEMMDAGALLIPQKKKLWCKAETEVGSAKKRKRGDGPSSKEYELDFREVDHINSALSDQTDVSGAKALPCNTAPQRCFNGQMVGHKNFLLSAAERDRILRADPSSATVIHTYLNGVDALTATELDRFVIDFGQRNQIDAAAHAGAFAWVQQHVLPDRIQKAEDGKTSDGQVRPHHKGFLARWWQLSFGRHEMLSVILPLQRYLACAYVTKRPIFMFVDSAIRPSNLIQVFGFEDDYSFGVLQSAMHWQWFITKCGKLKSDFRYSAESVFDTFPWPQGDDFAGAGRKQVEAVAEAGRDVRRVRDAALVKIKGGLRALYRTLELPGRNPLKEAHAALDEAVMKAYGFSARRDILKQVLDLNLAVARRIEAGQAVTAPGIPPTVRSADAAGLVTEDCIRPRSGASGGAVVESAAASGGR